MTEQSKIPLPDQPSPGRSLFERADELFGLSPAAVPKVLAEAPRKRGKREHPVVQEEAALPAVEPLVPVPAAKNSPSAPEAIANVVVPLEVVEPVAIAEPEPQPESPSSAAVVFGGRRFAIDRNHLKKQGLIQPDGKVATLIEEFRIVKRQLLLAAREAAAKGAGQKSQRILICSPLPGEGKTFCATNLAIAMAAEKDGEVVLIDADFGKPSVLSTLGLSGGGAGFMDVLADPNVRVEDCVLATDIPGLFVLPAGNPTNSDSEYLASSRTAAVLDRLTQGAPNRILIFDSPPALAASPAAELAKYVGQAVLVVRADTTGQTALEDALSLLSHCPDIKLLLNAAQYSLSGRRFGTYYGYGG